MPKSSHAHRKATQPHATSSACAAGPRNKTANGCENSSTKIPNSFPPSSALTLPMWKKAIPPKTTAHFSNASTKTTGNAPNAPLKSPITSAKAILTNPSKSAIRWCHEAAEMGARRLGHAIALGLDPEIAIARRPDAHVEERVGERLDQIAYDLNYAPALSAYGIQVNAPALRAERQTLKNRASDDLVERPYKPQRLAEIRNRQQFVLNRLARLGTVIETCPTPNLRIGGVPDPAHHPIHTFLKSDVNLAIGADDPGIFDSPPRPRNRLGARTHQLDAQSPGKPPRRSPAVSIGPPAPLTKSPRLPIAIAEIFSMGQCEWGQPCVLRFHCKPRGLFGARIPR